MAHRTLIIFSGYMARLKPLLSQQAGMPIPITHLYSVSHFAAEHTGMLLYGSYHFSFWRRRYCSTARECRQMMLSCLSTLRSKEYHGILSSMPLCSVALLCKMKNGLDYDFKDPSCKRPVMLQRCLPLRDLRHFILVMRVMRL